MLKKSQCRSFYDVPTLQNCLYRFYCLIIFPVVKASKFEMYFGFIKKKNIYII